MTTGVKGSIITTPVGWTGCSAESTIRNGSLVTWSGTDYSSAVKPKRRTVKKIRVVLYVRQPELWKIKRGIWVLKKPLRIREKTITIRETSSLPKTPKVPNKIDPKATADIFAGGNFFDRTRDRRFKEHDPAIQGEAGTPHPYVKTWVRFKESVFELKYGGGIPPSTCTVSNGGFGPFATDLSWGLKEEASLVSRLRSRIMGSDFNLASFLGAEGRDTVRFIGDTASRIYKIQSAMRRGNFGAAMDLIRNNGRWYAHGKAGKYQAEQLDIYRDLVDAVTNRRGSGGKELPWRKVTANQWLEYQLAIAPLLGDTEAAAKQLAEIVEMPRKQRYAASIQKGSGSMPLSKWAIDTEERRVRVSAYFKYEPSPLALSGFQDPEVTIWNAIPLTFVGDYFIPIGEYLEARATASALPPGTFIRSQKDVRKAEGLSNPSVGLGGADQAYERGRFERSLSGVLSVPTPEVKPLGEWLPWKQTMNIVALIVSNFSGKTALR